MKACILQTPFNFSFLLALALQVKLTLVLNKIDRLILEVKLTPEQAYERMKAIVTQVNMIVSSFQSEKYMSEADVILASQDVSAESDSRSPHPSPLLSPEDHGICLPSFYRMLLGFKSFFAIDTGRSM